MVGAVPSRASGPIAAGHRSWQKGQDTVFTSDVGGLEELVSEPIVVKKG